MISIHHSAFFLLKPKGGQRGKNITVRRSAGPNAEGFETVSQRRHVFSEVGNGD
jgi:hypothetical protein